MTLEQKTFGPQITIFEPDKKYRDFFYHTLTFTTDNLSVVETRAAVIDSTRSISPPNLVVLGEEDSGEASLETLIKLREKSSVPVIFADYSESDRHIYRVLEAGADQYWVKGRRSDIEFLAFSRALLRRSMPVYMMGQDLTTLNIINGGLVISHAGRVVVDGRDVPFSEQELKVVKALGANAGRVVTYSEINEALYGQGEFDFLKNTVRVFVHKVRGRFKEAEVDIPIITKPGIGYMMPDLTKKDER